MNRKRKEQKEAGKARKISDVSPELFLGHFPLRAINEQLNVKEDLAYLQLAGGFHFSLHDLLSDLIYARAVAPCSKRKTYTDVLPQLASAKRSYSLDQLYDAIAFLGSEYQKVIEIYNACVNNIFERDTSKTYFDCTNFFFEIDREDLLRKKGPSKENNTGPIVGLGLLLDADCIPLGMAIYLGNESEKPVMRNVISQVKRRNNMTGRTVRVADKGLNCADNIADAILAKDGYIFSKSVKQLPAKEQIWALSDEGFRDVIDRNGNLAYKVKSCVADFEYKITTDAGKKKKVELEEKRVVTYNPTLARKQNSEMIVTSEKAMSDTEIYSTYHQLWRIEESFKAMKSQLDARPVYLQKPEAITGHFLICYLAILLERLFQVKTLDDNFSTEEVMNFVRNFRAVEVSDRKYVNISKATDFISELETLTNLPLNNYHLTKTQVKGILDAKIDFSTN